VRNESIAPEVFLTLDDPRLAETLSDTERERLHNDVALLDGLSLDFDHELVLAGEQTPVFFGSALTNFGVRLFLDGFVTYAPSPRPYPSDAGEIVPDRPLFSGFIFKIQANMNPNHRDSVAFLRVCSGRFERDMSVSHGQTGKTLRLPRPYKFFANEREVIEEAFPGDIIGLPSSGQFAIGDTLSAGGAFRFAPIPRFQPEHFALLRNTDIGKQKQFIKGLRQLETEGAMQVLYDQDAGQRHPILAVVGRLQFEVVQARLETERIKRHSVVSSCGRCLFSARTLADAVDMDRCESAARGQLGLGWSRKYSRNRAKPSLPGPNGLAGIHPVGHSRRRKGCGP
jgi:peptide chain release factor 3